MTYAEAVASATEAESMRTPGELFADAAQITTAGRTASWLDQLVDDGHLTPDQRIDSPSKTARRP